MKWTKRILVYLNILTQSIAITDSMFIFGNFLTKSAPTFDQKEIKRKKRYLVGMKFCCASNAAIRNVKIARKKITFFPKCFQQNRHFLKKYRFLENIRYIFRFRRFFPSFWLLIYLFRSNNKAMNQLFPTSCWIHEKLWKSCQLYILRPPLRPNLNPQSKKFFRHMVLNYFLGKVPSAQ